MKVALCFLISGQHILNKEKIWKEWIEPNKDIINVYFHYNDLNKIKSTFIQKHTIPPQNLAKTSYYYVVPAYLALMGFAKNQCEENVWFIMLTESCVPVISPSKFRKLFFENYKYSIVNWKKAWWDIDLHKRANLRLLNEELRLANDPWFVFTKKDLLNCLDFSLHNKKMYQIICNGGLANESIFSIILFFYNRLKDAKKETSHAADWSRMSSSTSPHVFKEGTCRDLNFIENFLKKNKYTMFLRKVHPDFPDEILKKFVDNNSMYEKLLSKNMCEFFNYIIIFMIIFSSVYSFYSF